jgi:hypothetical protein
MSVGRNIERATGIRLFHNHMTIEPVLNFFAFGTPPFVRLVDGFRRRMFEEVAQSDLPGPSFTFVWNLDSDSDRDFIASACRPFRARGAEIAFIELRADLRERLIRNRTPERLEEKPSKRNLEQSESTLLELERYRLNTDGTFPLTYPHHVIDTNGRSSEQVAEEAMARVGLVPRGKVQGRGVDAHRKGAG